MDLSALSSLQVAEQDAAPVAPLRAVVLAGGLGTDRCPVLDSYATPLFPLLDGQPLLSHTLSFLMASGIREVAVTGTARDGRNDRFLDVLSRIPPSDLTVRWQVDQGNRGAGGALKELEGFLASGPAVVLHPNLWIESLDLAALWSAHRAQGAAVTMVLDAAPRDRRDLENVELTPDGLVCRYSNLHASRDNRRRLRPAGVYLIEPEVLEIMEPDSYVDLNEQLLTWLNEEGYSVRGYVTDTPVNRFEDATQYFDLNRRLMLGWWSELDWGEQSAGEGLGPGVRCSEDATVASRATIIGPVAIAKNCSIEEGARIIGPAMICEGTIVERGALIRDSVIWRNCRVARGASVEYSLLTESCWISPRERVLGAIVEDGGVSKTSLALEPAPEIQRPTGLGQLTSSEGASRNAYLAVKRALDIIGPLLALPILAPILLLVAVAVRMDSRGPILYRQTRCSTHGREFTLYKFRTMVENSDRLHAEILARNEVQGPMFKMKKDPRTTRIGAFLRRTSLDELPQLWNVVRGEMTLVGPRPLAMREMSWCPRWRDLRLRVKPGLTGLWQISARGEFSFDGWIAHDIRYVKNQSLWLDLRILLGTMKVLLKRSDAV